MKAMAILREWIARLWGTLCRRRADADLEAELRSHLELADADAGRAASAFAGGALRKTGMNQQRGVAQAMETLRDQRGLPWIDDFVRDARHALRLLRRNPVFAGVAVVSLALGIGVNSAIFAFADALILRPLPVPNPGAMVTVNENGPEDRLAGGSMSYPNYVDVRNSARSFEGLVAARGALVAFSRSRDESPEMRRGMLVSDNFFDALDVRPAVGRSFSADEARVPGRDAVVVLSDDFWRARFGADPSVVNRVVWMNGIDLHVIGITPAGFTTDPVFRPAFYVPAVMATRLNQSTEDVLEKRDARVFEVKGRLRSGVSRRTAQAELTTLWTGLTRQFPDANAHRTLAVRTELETRIREDPEDAVLLALLFALVALVLTIACANVANLMLGRARTRSREMAVRLALGVSRARLLRQLLTESLVLSLLGCGLGLVFADVGIRFLQTIPTADQIVIVPQLDERVLAFSLFVAIASAALFGLAPARLSLTSDLVPALKTSELGETTRPRTTGRNVLVIAQVAMSMVLLLATGMLLDGFRHALSLDPGFRTDHLMMLSLDPSLLGYTPQQTQTFYRNLIDRARALLDVRSATLTSTVPLQPGQQLIEAVSPEGYRFPPGQESLSTFMAIVDEQFFDTMRIRMRRGRPFITADSRLTRGVAIVNDEFAARYWPNQDPIGKRIRLPDRQSAWLDIVGVTTTTKYTWIGETPMPFLYLPFAQQPRPRMSLLVESVSGDAAELALPLRTLVHALDANQPMANLQTFAHMYHERAITLPSIIVRTVGAIGLLGLILSLVGLYGLVAYTVARRTREIGIRMAIGADGSDVRSMVLRQGLTLALTGVMIGGVASVVVARVLSALLVGVGTPAPSIYLLVPIALIGLTAATSYVPARRASQVDPLVALRDE
jgi:predicted permease